MTHSEELAEIAASLNALLVSHEQTRPLLEKMLDDVLFRINQLERTAMIREAMQPRKAGPEMLAVIAEIRRALQMGRVDAARGALNVGATLGFIRPHDYTNLLVGFNRVRARAK